MKKLPLSPFNDGRTIHVVKYNQILEDKVKKLEEGLEAAGQALNQARNYNKVVNKHLELAMDKLRRARGSIR